ncbi:MAG TPA: hypothetical protein VKB80_22385 [Kofleriaceae bacterium]|nr:hypothetical protein [Kofleriaceae bacterium]
MVLRRLVTRRSRGRRRARGPRRWVLPGAALAAALVFGLLGCDPPPTMIPPGPPPGKGPPLSQRPIQRPPPTPIEDNGSPREAAPDSAGDTSAPAGGGGGASAGAGAGTAAAPGAGAGAGAGAGKGIRDGGRCERGEQCASGVCEGLGCDADHKGTCMARNRSCTRDLRSYCGCDGKVFQASGSCPGRRFSARGACQ